MLTFLQHARQIGGMTLRSPIRVQNPTKSIAPFLLPRTSGKPKVGHRGDMRILFDGSREIEGTIGMEYGRQFANASIVVCLLAKA